ncbi:MAG: hypothetical protein BZ136_09495 [Methanosphaera sp. rholeuAM74]|nr:MAG: hypothetical protein BZ136_09495 [Methanosphaera sp. rholeuAM74]
MVLILEWLCVYDFKALYPDEIEYVKEFLSNPMEHKDDYKLLHDYYVLSHEISDELPSLEKELRQNINVHGMRLIRRAIGNRKEYEEVMRTLEHMGDIYN